MQDIEINEGFISAMRASSNGRMGISADVPTVDLKSSMVFPTFVDMHTHIGQNAAPPFLP